MQALTSFNVISFFEDFTAASYIWDERVHASDKDKEEKKPQSLQKPGWDARLFHCNIHHIMSQRPFVLMPLSKNICNAPLKW